MLLYHFSWGELCETKNVTWNMSGNQFSSFPSQWRPFSTTATSWHSKHFSTSVEYKYDLWNDILYVYMFTILNHKISLTHSFHTYSQTLSFWHIIFSLFYLTDSTRAQSAMKKCDLHPSITKVATHTHQSLRSMMILILNSSQIPEESHTLRMVKTVTRNEKTSDIHETVYWTSPQIL